MTKKDAALRIFGISRLIREKLEGDEDADVWVLLLEGTAHDLDPANHRYINTYLREPQVSRRVKLRRLIDHPGTPQPEREGALRALARLDASEEGTA